MPQSLINRTTGQPELIDDADMQSALASNKYETPDAVAVKRFGEDTYATPDIARREAAVTTPVDPSDVATAQGHAIRAQRNSGIIGGAKALAGGAIAGATLGLANPFEEAQEFNPIASYAGQFAGSFAPGLLTGGESEGAELASAIARDPIATEHVAGALSSKFLYGGEAGPGLEKALSGAGEHLDAIKAASQVPEDLSGLDAAGLRAKEDSHLDDLAAGQAAQQTQAKAAVVTDLKAYQAQFKDANPFAAALEGTESKPFTQSSARIRKMLDNEEGLARKPEPLVDALETQGQAMQKTMAQAGEIGSKVDKVTETLADHIEDRIQDEITDRIKGDEEDAAIELTGRFAQRYARSVGTKLAKGESVSLTPDEAKAFVADVRSGKIASATQESLGNMQNLYQANRALLAKVTAATAKATPRAELTSPMLTAIRGAKDALSTPQARSLGEEMLGGSVMGHVAGMFSGLPIIGPMLGAKAGKLASSLVFGRMGKTVAAGVDRSKAAAETFLNVAKRSAAPLAVTSSRILADTAFGPSPKTEGKQSMVDNYKARTAEIKAQTAYGPDGKPQMTDTARDAMSQRLAPIRSASPILADRIETLAAKRLEYLSSIIPRRPDIGNIQFGPDKWQPSDLEMRSFARSVSAAEDPHGVEERLATGQTTPEDAEAYHAIYPERAEALKQWLLQSMPKLQQTLPYARRLSLSIFSGVAVDPSLEPAILQTLQAQFQAEDGTKGGNEAPKPKPAFGSVRADIGTPSQQRETAMK